MREKAELMILPMVLETFFVSLYIGWVLCLFVFNTNVMLATHGRLAYSVTYLCIYHILLVLVSYCYFFAKFSNPGEPESLEYYFERPGLRVGR